MQRWLEIEMVRKCEANNPGTRSCYGDREAAYAAKHKCLTLAYVVPRPGTHEILCSHSLDAASLECSD